MKMKNNNNRIAETILFTYIYIYMIEKRDGLLVGKVAAGQMILCLYEMIVFLPSSNA